MYNNFAVVEVVYASPQPSCGYGARGLHHFAVAVVP